jgi:hypothetical protein
MHSRPPRVKGPPGHFEPFEARQLTPRAFTGAKSPAKNASPDSRKRPEKSPSPDPARPASRGSPLDFSARPKCFRLTPGLESVKNVSYPGSHAANPHPRPHSAVALDPACSKPRASTPRSRRLRRANPAPLDPHEGLPARSPTAQALPPIDPQHGSHRAPHEAQDEGVARGAVAQQRPQQKQPVPRHVPARSYRGTHAVVLSSAYGCRRKGRRPSPTPDLLPPRSKAAVAREPSVDTTNPASEFRRARVIFPFPLAPSVSPPPFPAHRDGRRARQHRGI